MARTVLNLSSGRRNGPSFGKHISHWFKVVTLLHSHAQIDRSFA